MGLTSSNVEQTKFDWSYSEEPHVSRRMKILQNHPEIKELFGIDPSFKYVTLAIVFTQLVMCYFMKDADIPLLLLQTYFVSGTYNHCLMLGVHEISHNAAFGTNRPIANRIFGMIANLPMGVPMSVTFKKYHLEHHRYMGEEGLDTDIPTEWEAKTFKATFGKLCFLFLQPIFYSFRPMVVFKKALLDLEVANILLQFAFDGLIVYLFGWKSLFYMVFGMFIGTGVHPLSGHFISDHYKFKQGQETYSYYGPINMVTFNVGYHIEHHDFPFVNGANLPKVRKMAPEFYEDWMVHSSWIYLLYDFVTNPDISLKSRIKRKRVHAMEFYGNSPTSSTKVYKFVERLMGFFGLQGAPVKAK